MRALRKTREFAAALGASVVVVFVRHFPAAAGEPMAEQGVSLVLESLDETEKEVEVATQEAFAGSGVSYSYVVREGDPAHEIIEAAHAHNAEFIVVGSTIHGAISSLLVSSVAEHLLHHSDVSLIVIRPDAA